MSISHIVATARRACAQARIPAEEVEPIRVRDNAVLRVVGASVVVRVHEPGAWGTATRELRVADWMRSHRVAAPEPLVPDPVPVGDRPVTFWEDLGAGGAAGAAATGRMLRTLHGLRVPSHLGLPRFELPNFAARVRQALTDDDSKAWLNRYADEVTRRWHAIEWPTEWRVIHGDPSPANTMQTPRGDHVVDLESCCVGPAEWDQATIALQTDTMVDPPSRWETFRQAYGADVTEWPGYQVIRDARRLQLCLFALRHADLSDHARKQANYRLECLRGVRGSHHWRWVAP